MAKGIRGYEYNPGKKAKNPGKRKRAIEEISCRSFIGQCDLEGGAPTDPQRSGGNFETGGAFKKVISPARRRQAVHQVQKVLEVSERRACRVIGQPRATHTEISTSICRR